jgi:V/A-type H+-transporting ATPase subunit I
MRHITLLTAPQRVEGLTARLRALGVLHLEALEELPPPQYADWQRLEKALSIARQYQEPANQCDASSTDPTELARRMESLEAERAEVSARLAEVEKSLALWQRWGDLDRLKWQELARRGLHLGLFETAQKIYEKTPFPALKIIELGREAKRVRFAALGSQEALAQLPFENVPLPTEERETLVAEKDRLEQRASTLREALQEGAQAAEALQQAQNQLREKWTFEQALAAYQGSPGDKPQWLEGWIPAGSERAVREVLAQEAVAFAIRKPRQGDRVPIALRNSRFHKLFEPITKIFQLPHYFEYDLTPFVAVFYPLLFAYCLGDAGYGAVLSLVALVGMFSFFRRQKTLATLGLVLGLFTTAMGLIKSGSLFGIGLTVDHQHPFIAFLGQFVLIPDGGDVVFNAFNVALMIGVVQILVGVLIAFFKTWRYEGFGASLSQAGKFLILTAAIALFLSDGLSLSNTAQGILQTQLGLGILLVMFFHDLGLAVLPRLGSSVLPLFFIFTGLLGDVLSYVRLFALGVTSAVLGLVVNQIGMNMMGAHWLSWVGAGAFLLLGHGLNFLLAGLGAFIHPLRLTFVEFYNNAQFAGGGQAYQPFKESSKNHL